MGRFRGKGCKPFAKHKPAEHVADGVFCDYSGQDGASFLGFVVVERGRKMPLSCPAETDNGEMEAVEMALASGIHQLRVFCDHEQTVKAKGVSYVKRNLNPAHKAAKLRRGFCQSRREAEKHLQHLIGKQDARI